MTTVKFLADASAAALSTFNIALLATDPTLQPTAAVINTLRDSLNALVRDLKESLICASHIYPTSPWNTMPYKKWINAAIYSLQLNSNYRIGPGVAVVLVVFTAQTSVELLTIYNTVKDIFGLASYAPPKFTNKRDRTKDQSRKCQEINLIGLFPALKSAVDILEMSADVADNAGAATSHLATALARKAASLSTMLTRLKAALSTIENLAGVSCKVALITGLATDEAVAEEIRKIGNAPEETVLACGSVIIAQSATAAVISRFI